MKKMVMGTNAYLTKILEYSSYVRNLSRHVPSWNINSETWDHLLITVLLVVTNRLGIRYEQKYVWQWNIMRFL